MKNQLKIGSILSYLQMGLSIIIGLIYTPIMIRVLGKSEYGLYCTVSSAISMLGILSLGFNSGYIRYYSIYKKKNDLEAIKRLNGLFLIIFILIGLIAMICGLFLSLNLSIVFDEGLTDSEYGKAKILMILLTVNLAVSFPMSVFQNIISAHERFIFLKVIGMMRTILSPLVTLPLLLLGYRSIAMVIVSVIICLVADILYLYYTFFVMKEKFIFNNFEKDIFKGLFVYTIFIAINLIIDQINWNIDKLLIGRFKGTSEVAVYSVGFSLYSYYMMFSTSISNVFTPRIHKIVNSTKNDLIMQRKQLTELFTKVGRIQFLVLGLIATGVVLFGKYFITEIWTKEGYDNSYYVSLLLIIPASVALIQNLGIEIQRAENKHQFRSIIYFFMALVNMGLSIVLCQLYGSVGSAIGTAISLIFANGIVMNIYYQKRCNIDIVAFWKNIGKQTRGLIIPVGYGIFYNIIVQVDSLSKFIIGVLTYSCIYVVSVWIISMNECEKNLITNPLLRIVKRKV